MVGKIPSLSGLATNSALNAVDNEIPDVRNLVEKTDYDTKFTEIEKTKKKKKNNDHDHDKYITTPDFDQLTEKCLLQD